MNVNKNKSGISGIVRIVVFVIVFVLTVALVSVQLFSGHIPEYSHRLRDAYSFVRDPEHTIDVVVVGNSDAYSAFNPIYMWEKYGITSTVSASPHQTVEESKRAISILLETQSPKVVIIEVDMLYDADSNDKDEKLGSEYFFSKIANPEKFENSISTMFSLFEYHNFWKGFISRESTNYSHGYKYNEKIINVKPVDYMIETTDAEYPEQTMLEQLDDLVNFCFANDMKVVFTEVFSMVSWSTQRHNAISQAAYKYGVDFIDFNYMYNELDVDMKTAFRDDKGYHVNYKTADAISDYIGMHVMNKYNVSSRNDDILLAQFWESDISEFNKMKKN